MEVHYIAVPLYKHGCDLTSKHQNFMNCSYVVCIIYNRTCKYLKSHVSDIFQISLVYFTEGIFLLKWDYKGHCVHCSGGVKKLKKVKE